MRLPRVDDVVRLTEDIPELALARGEVGVVRSTWFAPTVVYEVEFHEIGHDYQDPRPAPAGAGGAGRRAADRGGRGPPNERRVPDPVRVGSAG